MKRRSLLVMLSLLAFVLFLPLKVNASSYQYENISDTYHKIYLIDDLGNSQFVGTVPCTCQWIRNDINGSYDYECVYCHKVSQAEFNDSVDLTSVPSKWKNSKKTHGATLTQKTINAMFSTLFKDNNYISGIKSITTKTSKKNVLKSYKYNKKTGKITFKLKKKCTVTYYITMNSGAVITLKTRYK